MLPLGPVSTEHSSNKKAYCLLLRYVIQGVIKLIKGYTTQYNMFNNVEHYIECKKKRVKTAVYICGVAPAVFHNRPWVKPVTMGVVLEWVWCTQVWVQCVKIHPQSLQYQSYSVCICFFPNFTQFPESSSQPYQ